MTTKLKDMLTGAVKMGDFTLASGEKSNYYVNVKNVYTDPVVLREITKEMAKILKGMDIDKIAGVALGAVPIAVALSLELGIPFILIRKEKKEHGTNVQIEGELTEGDRVVMVEDVITTGGSVLRGIEGIRKRGTCDTVITVIDRKEGASELLSSNGIEIKSLATANELLGGD